MERLVKKLAKAGLLFSLLVGGGAMVSTGIALCLLMGTYTPFLVVGAMKYYSLAKGLSLLGKVAAGVLFIPTMAIGVKIKKDLINPVVLSICAEITGAGFSALILGTEIISKNNEIVPQREMGKRVNLNSNVNYVLRRDRSFDISSAMGEQISRLVLNSCNNIRLRNEAMSKSRNI